MIDRSQHTGTQPVSTVTGMDAYVLKSDIADDLTTEASAQPLSAAQGVALKALIDALDARVTALEGE